MLKRIRWQKLEVWLSLVSYDSFRLEVPGHLWVHWANLGGFVNDMFLITSLSDVSNKLARVEKCLSLLARNLTSLRWLLSAAIMGTISGPKNKMFFFLELNITTLCRKLCLGNVRKYICTLDLNISLPIFCTPGKELPEMHNQEGQSQKCLSAHLTLLCL